MDWPDWPWPPYFTTDLHPWLEPPLLAFLTVYMLTDTTSITDVVTWNRRAKSFARRLIRLSPMWTTRWSPADKNRVELKTMKAASPQSCYKPQNRYVYVLSVTAMQWCKQDQNNKTKTTRRKQKHLADLTFDVNATVDLHRSDVPSTEQTILAASGRFTGQCDRPGVWPVFLFFERALFLLLGREYATLESRRSQ